MNKSNLSRYQLGDEDVHVIRQRAVDAKNIMAPRMRPPRSAYALSGDQSTNVRQLPVRFEQQAVLAQFRQYTGNDSFVRKLARIGSKNVLNRIVIHENARRSFYNRRPIAYRFTGVTVNARFCHTRFPQTNS